MNHQQVFGRTQYLRGFCANPVGESSAIFTRSSPTGQAAGPPTKRRRPGVNFPTIRSERAPGRRHTAASYRIDTPLTPATDLPPEVGRPRLTAQGSGRTCAARRARASELLAELLELGAAYPEFLRPLRAAAAAALRESERTLDSARDSLRPVAPSAVAAAGLGHIAAARPSVVVGV